MGPLRLTPNGAIDWAVPYRDWLASRSQGIAEEADVLTQETAETVVAEVAQRSPDEHPIWWSELSSSEQELAIEVAPRELGKVTGLPGWALDQALRTSVAGYLDELQVRKQEQQELPEEAQQEVADKILSLEELQQVLAEPQRMLLGLDLQGARAKAAVAVGNVDTAEHIGVYTPGMGSTVHGFLAKYDDEMDRLRQRAIGFGRAPEDVATITWLGYEAPLGVKDVAQRDAAEVGSKLLRRFTDGIRSPREDRFHLVAIGHSYGSTTTALSLLADADHRIDDAVFFGSPGLGTNDVADFGLEPGHVFLLEAKDDAVADLGYFGRDPNQLEQVVILSTGPSEVGTEVTGHANYLNEGSTSQHNIATVVSGVPELAIQGMVLGFGDRVQQVIGFFKR